MSALSCQDPAFDDRIEIVRPERRAYPAIQVDSRLVTQALVNIFVNAFQAMPEGGTLTISQLEIDRGDRRFLRLIISDTGPGIRDEIRGELFKPFFTTRATGTGLGLAIVKRIVDAHGGKIEARGRDGDGTSMTIDWPTTDDDSAGLEDEA